jgi:folate-dependent phosphoribosylglycinamide formyltransferase PurN
MWIALIGELLDAKVAHVGLLVHWATDSIRRGPVLPRERLSVETMAGLEENVLVTFARRL